MAEQVPREPLMSVDSVLPILDRIAIFGGLTESQLGKVFQRLRPVSYGANQVVFEEGEAASYIYIVQEGAVKLVFDVYGEAHLKAVLTPGNCFGETSLIGIQPHSVTAITREPTELLVLSGDALNELLQEDKELFSMLVLNIARESCRRLFKTNEQLRNCLSLCPSSVADGILAY